MRLRSVWAAYQNPNSEKKMKKRNGFSEKVHNRLQEMLMSVFCSIVRSRTFVCV